MKVEPTGFWTFFCNPSKWDIDLFLAHGHEYGDYHITPWQAKYFRSGQFGVIRVGKDTRNRKTLAGRERLEAGVYAVVEILGKVHKVYDEDDEYWISSPRLNNNLGV